MFTYIKILCTTVFSNILSCRYLNSTIGNIKLISKFRKKSEEIEPTAEEQIFNFWTDYFVEATKTQIDDSIRFPVISNILCIFYFC